MCLDLSEYDPFEPLLVWNGGDGSYIDSEPMSDYDWEEWLEVEGYDLSRTYAILL